MRILKGKNIKGHFVITSLALICILLISLPITHAYDDKEKVPIYTDWGILLGTFATPDVVKEMEVEISRGELINPFTGKPFPKDTPVFGFGKDNKLLEVGRVLSDHFIKRRPDKVNFEQGKHYHIANLICHSNGSCRSNFFPHTKNVITFGGDAQAGRVNNLFVSFQNVGDIIPLARYSGELKLGQSETTETTGDKNGSNDLLRWSFKFGGPHDPIVKLPDVGLKQNEFFSPHYIETYFKAIQSWVEVHSDDPKEEDFKKYILERISEAISNLKEEKTKKEEAKNKDKVKKNDPVGGDLPPPGGNGGNGGNGGESSGNSSSGGTSFSGNLGKKQDQERLPNVSGVILHGVAKITGQEKAKINFSDGSFSFVVDGGNAYLDPNVLKKFVTALWSVYYSSVSPGISIDPIADGINEHLVRYIGNVINNDLGRVMREADYTMKKWAIGTESPDIDGFQDVDKLMASFGRNYFGASRRFWFVPESMRFKRGGDMLLFDRGGMTLKTEYVVQNKLLKAEQADAIFAEFFTINYNKIAQRYPIYKELFEYSKLVSLAQYLKESGVPLFWFMIANKHLVITEDSPGTVKELVKGSKYFEGVQIKGGVNLDHNTSQYVYDEHAIKAITEAFSMPHAHSYSSRSNSSSSNKETIHPVSELFSFNLGQQSYTALPQHTLTSGKDSKGIRYQTDLALRNNGQPGLELVRYFNPQKKDAGEFGEGWSLLIPYKMEPEDQDKVTYENVILPKRMAIENLLSGEREVLTFSTDRYSIVGYVPDSLKTSQVLGLFLMTDASYRLADKIGNEFHFDQAGYLTEMSLGNNFKVQFEYNDGLIDMFEEPPYSLQQVDKKKTEFVNAMIPAKLKVKDMKKNSGEVLVFKSKGGMSAYVPESTGHGKFRKMVLMTDGSFRLFDNNKNELVFDQTGSFKGIFPDKKHFRLVSAITQGFQQVKFKYTLDDKNFVRISESYLVNTDNQSNPEHVIKYKYDSNGKLTKIEREPTLTSSLPSISSLFKDHPKN